MDKTVLITGAAGGLGSAMVECFAGAGWRVIATDRMAPTVSVSGNSERIVSLAMDVTSDTSVQEAVAYLKSAGVTLDTVVNNAGIDRYFPLSEAPVDRFREVFEVNVFGAYRVNQQLLPLMRRPGGRILFIGSESFSLTLPFMAYPLSKRLLEGYAKALRQELCYSGIDVAVVRPGAIDTPLLSEVRGLKAAPGPWQLSPRIERFAAGATKEIGRTAGAGEVAARVLKIAHLSRTRMVYRINNRMKLRMAAWMPYGLMEWIVRRRLA